jgi:chromosomal replication initiation ATPase DnaA
MSSFIARIKHLEQENKQLRKKIITLSNYKKREKSFGMINLIFDVIHEITGYDKKDFVSQKKPAELSIVRQLAIFMMHKHGGIIQFQIAKLFCRHHSSIIYTINRVNAWQTYPFSYPKEIDLFNLVEECILKQIELNDEL